MNFIKWIMWKEFKYVRNDEITVRLIFLPIFVQMFVLGYTITTEVKNITVTSLDHCRTPQSAALVRAVESNRLFIPVGASASEAQAREKLDKGEARAAIIVPPDYSRNLERTGKADVSLLIDGQDANSSNVSSGYLNAIILDQSLRLGQRKLAAAGIDPKRLLPVSVRPEILFNPLLKSTWYMVPALAVLLVTIITGLLTGFSIVREKESGTLEQLLVTPIHPAHIVLGKIVPYVLIGLFELVAVVVFATLWFQIPFRGNVFTLLLFGVIYMISSLGIGVMVSTIARTPQQVLFFLWFILIFFMFLSGFFLPLENMPDWVRNITYINPLRYFMFIQREIFLKGSGIVELWREGLAMLAIGFVFFTTAVLTFSRKVG
jgi:ABC-2 type transport system permease protein